jgi:hypothetical protein
MTAHNLNLQIQEDGSEGAQGWVYETGLSQHPCAPNRGWSIKKYEQSGINNPGYNNPLSGISDLPYRLGIASPRCARRRRFAKNAGFAYRIKAIRDTR